MPAKDKLINHFWHHINDSQAKKEYHKLKMYLKVFELQYSWKERKKDILAWCSYVNKT